MAGRWLDPHHVRVGRHGICPSSQSVIRTILSGSSWTRRACVCVSHRKDTMSETFLFSLHDASADRCLTHHAQRWKKGAVCLAKLFDDEKRGRHRIFLFSRKHDRIYVLLHLPRAAFDILRDFVDRGRLAFVRMSCSRRFSGKPVLGEMVPGSGNNRVCISRDIKAEWKASFYL